MPSWPDVDKVFIPGDEIMIVFSAEKMRPIGLTDSEFINAGVQGAQRALSWAVERL